MEILRKNSPTLLISIRNKQFDGWYYYTSSEKIIYIPP